MKRLIWLLLFASAATYAQTAVSIQGNLTPAKIQTLQFTDFLSEDGRMLITEKSCQIPCDNHTDRVIVSVICLQNVFKEIGVDKINDMLVYANQKVRSLISRQQKYLPGEIKMVYNPQSKEWNLTNAFQIEDENGIAKANLLTLDYNTTGEFLKIKKVF